MATVKQLLQEQSEALAAQRGAYPAFEASVHAQRRAAPRRNATVTANAPNSTISAIAGCSSGIEPLFALSFTKLLRNGDRLQVVNPEFVRVARERGFATPALMQRIERGESIQDDPEVPQDVKEVFVTAHEIPIEAHIRVQSAFQDHTELACAKTINLPSDASVEDVRRAFFYAHEMGCKGITCFRDGCRDRSFLTARVCETDSDKPASC
jgi:ribonucleoside-diphosphate reductase alpha chain